MQNLTRNEIGYETKFSFNYYMGENVKTTEEGLRCTVEG